MNEWMNEWTDGRTDERTNEQTKYFEEVMTDLVNAWKQFERTSERVNEWSNEHILRGYTGEHNIKLTNENMHEWASTGTRTSGWIIKWTKEPMNKCTNKEKGMNERSSELMDILANEWLLNKLTEWMNDVRKRIIE